jgi:eukaryotic-like serine/threonine-protein kinase
MPATAPLSRGVSIAPGYEVIEHLSRGRRLDVYDAWSEERACRCVVKILRPERMAEEGPRRMLMREGRLLERLSHPHLVRGYETLEEPAPLVVMETLTGQTLSHVIEEEQRELSPLELAHLGLHLGAAMRYLHANGFLHLDLKPANVVAEAGRGKVIDLSLARPPGPAPAGTGTWCYLAPEQANGAYLGPAADVWGIGVVLFEAATGSPAFADGEPEGPDGGEDTGKYDTWVSADGETASYPQLEGRAVPVESLRSLPPGLGGLIDSCLDPDAERRPSLERLLAMLEPAAGIPPAERRFGLTEAPPHRQPPVPGCSPRR